MSLLEIKESPSKKEEPTNAPSNLYIYIKYELKYCNNTLY